MHLAMNDGVSTRTYHPHHDPPHHEAPRHETHRVESRPFRDPGPAHRHLAVAQPAHHVDEVHISQLARRLAEDAGISRPAPKHEEHQQAKMSLSSLWSEVKKVAHDVERSVEHDVSHAVEEARRNPPKEAPHEEKPAPSDSSSGSFWSKVAQSVGNAVHDAEHAAHEVTHDVGQAAHAVVDEAGNVAQAVEHGADRVEHAVAHEAHQVARDVEDVVHRTGHAVAHEARNVEHAVEREARHIGSQVEHVAHRIEHAAANEVHKVEHRVSEGVHVLRQEVIHAYQKTKHAVDRDIASVEHEARRIGHAVEHVAKTVAEHPGAVAMASLEVVGGAAETIGGAALGLVTSETVVGAVIGAAAVVDGASKTGAGIADLASVLNGKIDQVGTHNVLQNMAKQYGGTTGEVVYDTASLGLGFVGGGVSDAKQVAEVVASHGKTAVNIVKAGTKQLQDLTGLGNRWSPSLAFASDGGRVSQVANGIEDAGKDAHVVRATVGNEGQVTEQTSAPVKASEGVDKAGNVSRTPIQKHEVTTYQDFTDRSVVGDNLEGHEVWQHSNLKANGLATKRLSTNASKNNPVIALDKSEHQAINRTQKNIDVTHQTPEENIKTNAEFLRKVGVPKEVVEDITQKALNHARNLLRKE